MASIKQTIKFGMLRYPTLFPNPVNVLEHLFCVIGNGYDWIDGELVDNYDPERTNEPLTMNYPENEEDDFVKRYPELENYVAGFRAELKLKDSARRVQMKFVEDNIDAIVEGNPTAVYFGNTPRGYYFTKGICIKYAKAFSFPENIKEDWAKTLYTFLNYWLVALNQEYGVSNKNDEISFWPTDMQEARKAILETRNRLHPYAHNGQTYEEYVTKMRVMLDSLKSKE